MQLTPTNALRETALEIAEVAQAAGWDAPPRLYALVRTAALAADEPALARELGIGPEDVDDSFTARTLQKSILEAEGYDVRIAVDGAAGVVGPCVPALQLGAAANASDKLQPLVGARIADAQNGAENPVLEQ